MQNAFIHRDRQIRNKDFKVSFSSSPGTTANNTNINHSIFVGEDNGIFTEDRWRERNDISQTSNSAAQSAFDLLLDAHDAMPYLDNDPRYTPMDRPVYVPVRPASELDVWKQ